MACCLDLCVKPGTLTCSACRETKYCCQAHQKEAWKMHKTECKLIQEHRQKCTTVVSELRKETKEEIVAAYDLLTTALSTSAKNTERLATLGVFNVLCTAASNHKEDADVQERMVAAIFNLCATGCDDARRQQATDAGALEVAAEALKNHTETRVTINALKLLRKVADGVDEAGVEKRCERACAGGTIEAVVPIMAKALCFKPGAAPGISAESIAEEGCAVLCLLSFGLDEEAAAERSERAAKAGGIDAVIASMKVHTKNQQVQTQACSALANLCGGFDEAAVARRLLARSLGAVEAVEVAGYAGGRAAMALDVLETEERLETSAQLDADGAASARTVAAEINSESAEAEPEQQDALYEDGKVRDADEAQVSVGVEGVNIS